MIKDLFLSLKENIKTKSTNPFFGTLIFVWSHENWELIYSIFNFNVGTKLEEKVKYIIDYFKLKPFEINLFYCVFETFLVLIFTFILINFTRLIVNFFEKKITPKIYEWTDKNSIVLIEVYKDSENERMRLEKKIEEERLSRLKLQQDYDTLENRMLKMNTETKKEIESNIPLDVNKSIFGSSSENIQIEAIYKKFESEEYIKEFEEIVSKIKNNKAVDYEDAFFQQCLTLGLLEKFTSYDSLEYAFSITTLGQELFNLIFTKKYN